MRAPDSLEAVNRIFHQRGWTDGLPIVPPTRERLEAMLGGWDPREEVAVVEPRLGRGTAGKLAVNAVMAGCEPAHFEVVAAATRAMCDPRFNLKAIQSTTHPCTVLVLVNGPLADTLEINGAYNAMGQGRRANAAIGRAIRFILLNVAGPRRGSSTARRWALRRSIPSASRRTWPRAPGSRGTWRTASHRMRAR